jgi:hypothetical protein
MFQAFTSKRRTAERCRIILFTLLALSILLTACNAQTQSTGSYATVPAGKAYLDGKEIFFTHTEASDKGIAEKLSNMMKSPVVYVPSLAKVPAEALADVYVFENGISGKGPLGFQSDVFDNPPGSDGYSPLRQIILVKWADGAKATELKSVADIKQAETSGALTTSKPGVVVNMPFMVWDGGKR